MIKKSKLQYAELSGLLFCMFMSFIFHFAYDWSGKSQAVRWLFAINESVWEHGKLVFYPYLAYSIFEYFIIKPDRANFITAKGIPLLFVIPLMMVMYYTYTGITGIHLLWVDITICMIVIAISYIYSYVKINKKYKVDWYKILLILVVIIFVLIIVFSYSPPSLPLFLAN